MLRAAILAVSLALPGAALAADPVFPPGSRLGLVPPESMQLARGMPGFHDPSTGAAIMLIEMPVDAYPSVSAGFSDEALKAQGFAARTRDVVKIGTADALLVSGEQTDRGQVVPKAILLAADPTATMLVIAQLPVGAPEAATGRMRDALRTVAIRPPLSLGDQLAALPFRVADTAGFRPVRVMAGNSVLLTDGPADMVRDADQPVLILAQSFAPAPPTEQREAFARAALTSNLMMKETVLERSQGFRQGGAEWHEIVAKAKEGPSGQPVVILQTIRFQPDGYLRMVGIVRADQRDAIMPRFRRAVDSVAMR